MQSSGLTSLYRVSTVETAAPPRAVDAPATRSLRFVACDAELRIGPRRRCLAIGLHEGSHPRASIDLRLVILVVWRGSFRSLAVGRYDIEGSPPVDAAVGISAYLTYRDEWRCFDASRATEGRISIWATSASAVGGAFDLTFANGRFHGTFFAQPRRLDPGAPAELP